MKLPQARTENIVVQNSKDEVLIYDLSNDKAFCLNETSAKVFNACDGATTFAELKNNHQLTDEIIYLALDGLRNENLIIDDYVSPFAGMNRREMVRRVGLASMIALPAISAIIAPTAAHAASNTCSIGTCIPARQNLCAGCGGRRVTFDTYPAGSNCMGAATGTLSINCSPNDNLVTVVDEKRTAVN